MITTHATARRIHLQANTIYSMGASATPRTVLVTSVGPDRVTFRTYPFSPDTERTETRWIAEDLIARGTSHWLAMYGAQDPTRAAQIRTLLAGQPCPEAVVDVADYEPVMVEAVAAEGQGDLWRAAEAYGNVGASIDDGRYVYEIMTNRKRARQISADARFVVIEVRDR